MKEKPIVHKSQNTFRFLTFAEHLSNVKIDVIKRGKTSENPDGVDTFFQEALQKWSDLNYTSDFDLLLADIGKETKALSQIVFRQDEIVGILLRHLEKPETLALDGILALIVALARDLQVDFYPYFPKFFVAITQHLLTKDTDRLEKIFMCLSYLFKFLWRYMVKDMKNVYRLFSVLLDDANKEYVRNFSAESFSFLARKVPNKPEFFRLMLGTLKENPMQSVGLGQLLFEIVKGVKKKFHSCAEEGFRLLLTYVGSGLDIGNEEQYSLPWMQAETALAQMLKSMASHTVKGNADFVQNIFCEVIQELLNNMASCDTERRTLVVDHLDRILRLFLSWVRFRKGMLIQSNEVIVQVLTDLCQVQDLPKSCIKSLGETISSIFLSGCVHISPAIARNIISLVYGVNSREVIMNFTKKMISFEKFEKDVLPHFLTYCAHVIDLGIPSDEDYILELLAETVVSLRPLPKFGDDVKNFSKLDFSCFGENRNSMQIEPSFEACHVLNVCILNAIDKSKTILSFKDLRKVWCILLCVPHLRVLDMDSVSEGVKRISEQLHDKLMDSSISPSNFEDSEKLAFVLCQSIISWICINPMENISTCFPVNFFTDLLVKFPKCVSVLRVTEIFLCNSSSVKKGEEAEKTFVTIFSHLFPNLASPFHNVRIFTLGILCSFDLPLEQGDNGMIADGNVFSYCLEAENAPISIQSYRERIKWLQKLEFPFVKKSIPTTIYDQCLKAPVYYLLGSLYVNFNLLWKPASGLLETYAHGLSKTFWEIFFPYLDNIVDLAERVGNGKECIEEYRTDNIKALYQEPSFLHRNLISFYRDSESPNVLHHRNLLWQTMSSFPDVVEPRNEAVIPLLFKFIKNEVSIVDTSVASSETVHKIQDGEEIDMDVENDTLDFDADNLDDQEDLEMELPRKKRKFSKGNSFNSTLEHSVTEVSDVVEDVTGDEAVEPVDDCNESDVKFENEDSVMEENSLIKFTGGKRKIDLPIKRQKGVTKTLALYLTLFSKFKNPKSFSQNEELHSLYYELLSYRNVEIQKLAFDCIMTYKHKYLVPYKDNFYNILDDKSFKTEVVLFSLDETNGVIQEKHRKKLLPVLMKILHGKMAKKTGNSSTGKARAGFRQTIVLRFLAGCRAEELQVFIDLVVSPFKELIESGDILSIVKNIRQNLDLSSIVPLRKQQSVLNTLGTILHNVGNLVPEILPEMLKLLLIIAATSTVLLEKREEIFPHYVPLLKTLRTLAIMKIIQFFKLFSHYNFSREEIDAVFEGIIWPMVPQIRLESACQPSTLLRLLSSWSKNSRFFPLFAKRHDTLETLSIIPQLLSLYTAPRASSKVVRILSQMFNQLLTEPNYDSEDNPQKAPEIAVNNCLSLTSFRNSSTDDPISYGSMLLLPHVDMLLKRLRMTIAAAAKNTKMNLDACDLNILLRVSEYVEDPELCFELKDLLIPFLTRSRKFDEDCEVAILSTIRNLVKRIKSPKDCVKSLLPLFSHLTHWLSRMSLIEIFKILAEKDDSLQKLSDLAYKINARNSTVMEEPDYVIRSDGYNAALEIISNVTETFDEDIIAVVIYTSAFTIKSSTDMFLRNSSSHLLQDLGKHFSKLSSTHPNSFKTLVFDILMPEIAKGFKSKTQVVFHEFVRILAALLRHCGSHPRLQNLATLCNEDQDLDFWENITHPQVHRRARALLRVSNGICDKEIVLHYHVIKVYILPIVYSFLFDEAYQKNVHVVDAAIETLGSIARVMSWSNYEYLLRYYLNLISISVEHHKTIIKIIVSILNAFHFDLSESREIKSGLLEPPRGKRKRNAPEDCHKDKGDVILDNAEEVSPDLIDEDNVDSESKINADKATKIHLQIVKVILPQLHRTLMQKTKSEIEIKLAVERYYPEDEEILRVPIAFAMVKLLQNLPHDSMKVHLPGILLKMCNLLRSRTESIRMTTRETLIKMMQSLGPSYFYYLLNEMRGVLTKGYQVHIMNFTIHAVLRSLQDRLSVGDLDLCVSKLSEVCINELFTDMAEEKEVAKITSKLKEAKSTKSYLIYNIVGQFVSGNCLAAFVQPLLQILRETYSYKKVNKVQMCLNEISRGIGENKGISLKTQLIFAHSLIAEGLLGSKKDSNTTKPKKEPKFVRIDCRLIPKAPTRSGFPAKINRKTNDHIIVEFGLKLLNLCIKREKLSGTEVEHLEMLDPFITILTDCLDSSHVKIISMSLRCLVWIFKFPLPSLKDNIETMVKCLFILINKYAGEGKAQGEILEMVVICFKMMTVLVRDSEFCKLTSKQLSVLLSYVAEDINSFDRQATGFSLLKAILSKKLSTDELPEIMEHVQELSINSVQECTRAQCRQASLQYLLDYSLGRKVENTLIFYVTQLEYLHEPGRVSAMEMINSIIKTFPVESVKDYCGLFFVPLATRLINDDSKICRNMSALAIRNILDKIDDDGRTSLFNIPFSWLKDRKLAHQRLGLQCCGLFAEAEGEDFLRRLGDVMPLLEKLLDYATSANVESLSDERCTDHFVFHLLNAISKIFFNCSVIRNESFSRYCSMWDKIQQLILHPHHWVRFTVCQLYGLLFSKYSVSEVVASVNSQEESTLRSTFASRQKLRDLSADFATQLQSEHLNESFGDQVLKNLVYLANIISRVSGQQSGDEDGSSILVTVTLQWMLRKLRREVKKEVSLSPNISIRRNIVFKFLAAVALDLGEVKLIPMLPEFLSPLCRELSDNSPNADQGLKTLAKEVLDHIRNIVGTEIFTSEYAIAQTALFKKKAQRKLHVVEAVTNPQKYALRKIQKQLNEKERKKRKFSKLKGKKPKKSRI